MGVAPLKIDERLNESAQFKADDMAKYNYFAHVKPGETGMNGVQKGYDLTRQADGKSACSKASENIGFVPFESANSKAVFDGWYLSAPHIAAIRNADYSLTWIAVAKGATGYYAVEHFCIAR